LASTWRTGLAVAGVGAISVVPFIGIRQTRFFFASSHVFPPLVTAGAKDEILVLTWGSNSHGVRAVVV
jgi:hypothetical protein